jgi:hypothetical protein
VQIGVTCAPAADLEQHLARPWFWYRHIPKLARLLPFDELERLDDVASESPVASLALAVLDPVELDF